MHLFSLLDECQTVDQSGANKPCIFPFNLEGITYNTCTLVAADNDKPWCSTRVDNFGNHVTGGGHYGDCGPKCFEITTTAPTGWLNVFLLYTL